MVDLATLLADGPLLLDGCMGTLLQDRGLTGGADAHRGKCTGTYASMLAGVRRLRRPKRRVVVRRCTFSLPPA